MSSYRTTETATIANAGTTSNNVTVPVNTTLLGFITPASMTGTAITFKGAASSDATPVPVMNESAAYSITIDATARFYRVNREVFEGISFLQLVSNSAEGAEREITLVFGRTN